MTTTTNTAYKPFELGQIFITPGAKEALTPQRFAECVMRHLRGDWGLVCSADAAENNLATHQGFRIFSAYPIDPGKPAKGHGANCFWIITEADRSCTTALLPEEY